MKKFNEENLTETEKNEWCLTFLKRTLLVGGVNILLCAVIGETFYWVGALLVYALFSLTGVSQLYYYRTISRTKNRFFAFWNLPKDADIQPSERGLRIRRIAGWVDIGVALTISFIGLFICF